MVKVSDYIVKLIANAGVKHVFMVTGGGMMHLADSVGKCKELEYICNHHEQACAIAAEGYARISENIGVVMVTSGPGGTNTLTGILGQWLDSIPALDPACQVRNDMTAFCTVLRLRHLGDQEANIVEIVRSITKYAVMVTEPKSIRYHLEKAFYLARSGRPGPVWLDVPLNVQAALIDEADLPAYDPREDEIAFNPDAISRAVASTLERMQRAERPVLLGGNGIRLAGAVDVFHRVIELLNVPVQTAMGANDLLHSGHPLFVGRPSVTGDRSSNFVVQNCDLLLAIGARLGVRTISYSFDAFARAAYKIVVDVDPYELQKPTVRPDMPVHCDAKVWLEEMARQLTANPMPPKSDWLDWCITRRRRYPSVLPEYREQKDFVNSFYFVEVLSEVMSPDDVIVLGDGTANTCTFQAIELKKGQRLFTNSGCAAMGYDLPAAIGACFANGRRRVICITGDGSIQLNLQELQTIAFHRLPIKIFLLSNDGYLSIRSTQEAYFSGHYVGSGSSSGVGIPDMVKIAEAYGLATERISDHSCMRDKIQRVLDLPGPVLCDIQMSPLQTLYPKVASEQRPDGTMVSKPLEDMFPFLEREEFMENMLIAPWQPPS